MDPVTIIMTVRENYSFTVRTISSLIQHTTIPYRLIYLDYKTPEPIKNEISKFENVEIIEAPDSPYPMTSRIANVDIIDTDYTVYLDNNILFSPLWLEKLIECMEEQPNAGIVGPIYLWKKNKIHMFGGNVRIENGIFNEEHYLMDRNMSILTRLRTRKCDFVEYHCLMIRTKLLKQSVLDSTLLAAIEHIDLSMEAKKLGYETYTTPESVITYENEIAIEPSEYDLFRQRWNANTVENDIKHFCEKWKVIDNFNSLRDFIKEHNKKIQTQTPRTRFKMTFM
jgi:GT2 family glycosyltransferase